MPPVGSKCTQLLSLKVEYYFVPGSSTSRVHFVCVNASLCINSAEVPHIYFTFMKRNSLSIASTLMFLTLQYGNLIDFAAVYKRTIKPRNYWFQQLSCEMELGNWDELQGKREGKPGVLCSGNQVFPFLGSGVKGSAQSGWWEAMGKNYLMINGNQLWGWREGKQTREAERES